MKYFTINSKKIQWIVICGTAMVILWFNMAYADASADTPKYLSFTAQDKLKLKTAYQGPIRFSMDFHEGEKLKWIAGNHPIVITRHASPAQIHHLKQYNKDIAVLQYVNIKGVKGNELDRPFFNEAQNKSLFWKDKDKDKVHNKYFNWYMVDIRNHSWGDALISILSGTNNRYAIATYDGVMLDDTQVTWMSSLSKKPLNYKAADEYNALHWIVRKIKSAFPKKMIVFNGYCNWVKKFGENSEMKKFSGLDFLDSADAISFETITRNFQGRSYGKQRTVHNLNDFYSASSGRQKDAFFVESGKHDDIHSRIFSVASYFLVENEFSFYNFIATDIGSPLQSYAEYFIDLGQPGGTFVRDAWLFRRKFEKGEVAVNFGDNDREIKIPEKAWKLTVKGGGDWDDPGELVKDKLGSSLTLRPMSAVVLVY